MLGVCIIDVMEFSSHQAVTLCPLAACSARRFFHRTLRSLLVKPEERTFPSLLMSRLIFSLLLLTEYVCSFLRLSIIRYLVSPTEDYKGNE